LEQAELCSFGNGFGLLRKGNAAFFWKGFGLLGLKELNFLVCSE